MKKTIAKLMAAAMMLSTVPAVTLPSFVSNAAAGDVVAATNTTTATYTSQFLGGEGTVKAASNGEIFSYYLPNKRDGVAGYFFDTTKVSSDDFELSVVAAGLPTEVADKIKLDKVVTNDLVHVRCSLDVTKMTSAQKTSFVNAVKANTNTFRVKVTRKNIDMDGNPNNDLDLGTWNPGETKSVLGGLTVSYQQAAKRVFNDRLAVVSERVYAIGGTYDNGKIKTGVSDEDSLLMDGNVYAKIDKTLSDGIAEVEILKQDNNEANKLKDNDQLRGKLLKLNVVKIGGVEYKVGKLGSQALKQAKMKKIQLKNCSKVGKGAMRKCKQLKNVNLKDKNKVRKIHAKAFYDCKNLKTITIDARKLNTVGSDSFTKLKKNCKIKLKASKSKYNSVVKKIKKYNKKANALKFARIAP
jgi:hypothetical protein